VLAREVGANLRAAADTAGRRLVVVSRSDSTLRGHYPAEVTALEGSLGMDGAVHVLIPFFEEGGRWTIDDVHYVADESSLIPAAQTPFARDASFGFSKSNLKEWVEEKTGGRIPATSVHSIGLDMLRAKGPQEVTRKLRACRPGDVCVVNAVAARDLEVFVVGSMRAESKGPPLLFRTAASFVQVRAGLAKRPLLSAAEVCRDRSGGILIVVGSYVPKSSRQLERLVDEHPTENGLTHVQLNVERLLRESHRAGELEEAVRCVNSALRNHRDVVVSTSRQLVTGVDADESLRIGQRVSAALVDVTRSLETAPRLVIAKGGITSSDVATAGLGVKRAMVLGQLIDGVPVWRLGEESRFPGLGYVVFPGNVGGDAALSELYAKCVTRSEPGSCV
jgi:uncharacterized protein YgbK (DUF1537 family)